MAARMPTKAQRLGNGATMGARYPIPNTTVAHSSADEGAVGGHHRRHREPHTPAGPTGQGDRVVAADEPRDEEPLDGDQQRGDDRRRDDRRTVCQRQVAERGRGHPLGAEDEEEPTKRRFRKREREEPGPGHDEG